MNKCIFLTTISVLVLSGCQTTGAMDALKLSPTKVADTKSAIADTDLNCDQLGIAVAELDLTIAADKSAAGITGKDLASAAAGSAAKYELAKAGAGNIAGVNQAIGFLGKVNKNRTEAIKKQHLESALAGEERRTQLVNFHSEKECTTEFVLPAEEQSPVSE